MKMALACAAVQVGLAIALAPGPGIHGRYLRLDDWDSKHYLDVLERGYRLPRRAEQAIAAGVPPSDWLSGISARDVHEDRANLAFFPGFPLIARGVSALFRLAPEESLLATSQVFCWIFWAHLFLFLGLRGLGRSESWEVALLVAAYPTSFYLVMGYSESLFMGSLLGVVFWTEKALQRAHLRRAWIFWTLAGASGLLLSSSRIVGVPLAIYPALRTWIPLLTGIRLGKIATVDRTRAIGSLWASMLAALGGLTFFLWCALRFGKWDLYVRLQEIGWKNYPDYLALLKPGSYLPRFFFEDTMDSISRTSVPACMALMIAVGARDWRQGDRMATSRRAGLYISAFIAFFLSVAGKANSRMDSMSRYTFPVFTLTVVAWAWLRMPRGFAFRPAAWIAFAAAFALQAWMAYMFLRGHWVA